MSHDLAAKKSKICPELTFTLTHHDAALTPAPREQGESPVSVARFTLVLTLPLVPNPQMDAAPPLGSRTTLFDPHFSAS